MGTLSIQNPVLDNPVQDFQQLDTLSSGWATGTALEQSFVSSVTPSQIRASEQAAPNYGPIIAGGRGGVIRGAPTSPLLSPDDANKQAADLNLGSDLKFTKSIRQGEFDLIAKWKKEEIERNYVLSRADKGFIPGAARLGAGFLGAAVDPVNIALSFVPVVGEARYAYLAERLGPTAARVLRGAAEGAVGQAAAEPLIYLQAQNQQADYSAYDSIMNIAFGAVLGGGLHAGFGKISDWIGLRSIETREMALRGAVAAIAEDRPVHVAEAMQAVEPSPRRVPIIEADQANIGQSITDFVSEARPGPAQRTLRVGQVSPETVQSAAGVGVDLAGFDHVMQAHDVLHTLNRHGEGAKLRPDEIPVTPADLARVPDIIATADSVRTEKTKLGLPALVFTKREGNTSVVVEEVRAGKKHLAFKSMRIKKAGGPDTAGAEAPVYTAEPIPGTATDNLASDGLDINTQNAEPDILEQRDFAVSEAVDAQRRSQSQQPEDQAVVNAIATKAVNYDKPITPETTTQEVADLVALADEGINHLKAEGRLSDADLAEIQGANELVNEARNRGAGIQAAAACFVRSL